MRVFIIGNRAYQCNCTEDIEALAAVCDYIAAAARAEIDRWQQKLNNNPYMRKFYEKRIAQYKAVEAGIQADRMPIDEAIRKG